MEIMTNQKFAAENEVFQKACEAAGVKPTARQASKWRMGKGAAWQAHKFEARREAAA